MGLGWLLLLAGGVLHGWWLLHGYLTNASAFPQPLSADEEKAALQALCRGDSDARRRLIEHNLRLVAHIVKKFEGCGEDTEDLIQIGTVGLIKGVETYRHDKGTRLATYAARCNENEILMHLRARRKMRREVFLEEPINRDGEGNEVTLMDILPDESESIQDQVGRRQQARRLAAIIRAHLGRRERQVLQMRYGFGGAECKTQREIAVALGISRSYVSRIEKKAMRKIGRALQHEQDG